MEVFFMITFKRNENKQLSKHFNSKEFECKCGKCDNQIISEKLIEKLEQIRTRYGQPLVINSGYRCPDHNKAIGSHPSSTHTQGLAADIAPKIITVDSLDAVYELCYDIFDNIGDGRPKRFIHVDVRDPKPNGKRKWLY